MSLKTWISLLFLFHYSLAVKIISYNHHGESLSLNETFKNYLNPSTHSWDIILLQGLDSKDVTCIPHLADLYNFNYTVVEPTLDNLTFSNGVLSRVPLSAVQQIPLHSSQSSLLKVSTTLMGYPISILNTMIPFENRACIQEIATKLLTVNKTENVLIAGSLQESMSFHYIQSSLLDGNAARIQLYSVDDSFEDSAYLFYSKNPVAIHAGNCTELIPENIDKTGPHLAKWCDFDIEEERSPSIPSHTDDVDIKPWTILENKQESLHESVSSLPEAQVESQPDATAMNSPLCIRDACGVCNGNNQSCVGCDGIPNSGTTYDLCGECGGQSQSCIGCDGYPFSGKVLDRCGVCGGNGTTCLLRISTNATIQSTTNTSTTSASSTLRKAAMFGGLAIGFALLVAGSIFALNKAKQNADEKEHGKKHNEPVKTPEPIAGGQIRQSASINPPQATSTEQYKSRIALFTYTPNAVDELEFTKGDIIRTFETYDDGWALGVNLMRSTKGVFPLNYTESHN